MAKGKKEGQLSASVSWEATIIDERDGETCSPVSVSAVEGIVGISHIELRTNSTHSALIKLSPDQLSMLLNVLCEMGIDL